MALSRTEPLFFLGVALATMARYTSADLVFSAGFSDDAVFQRSATDGAFVYGFVDGS